MLNPSSCRPSKDRLLTVLRGQAQAVADIVGSGNYPELSGTVRFYQTRKGVIVYAEISGLPHDDLPCHRRVFGFHIHSGTDCGGDMADPFADAMSHYNPSGCEHPYHAGDLPPLFENGGSALSAFLTDRFSVSEVIGKTVIIHDQPDDFTTQPSGHSGAKIACGVIRRAAGNCSRSGCF